MDEDLQVIEIENLSHQKRPFCSNCLRPQSVCWCPWLPESRLQIQTHILILQHPYEESRKVRTARILELALPEDRVRVVRGRKFNAQRQPDLVPILTSPSTFLLYPHRDAIPADVISSPAIDQSCHHLVLLDGTWSQARNMLVGNPLLHSVKKICLPVDPTTGQFEPSAYIVRRQPHNEAVSTVEAVARILDLWEPKPGDPSYFRRLLLEPLHQICRVQRRWAEQSNHD